MNLRFPGQYFDAETQTHYNYFRDYDPDTGRYLTSDPMGVSAGLNSYSYVNANPLQSIDLFGLASYVIGNADPAHPFDIGSGAWNSVEKTSGTYVQKNMVEALLVSGVGEKLFGVDAVRHMEHFLENTGDELTVDISRIRAEVHGFNVLYRNELKAATNFVKDLASDLLKSSEQDCKAVVYDITSSIASSGRFGNMGSKNWFYAIGSFYYWGKGSAQIWKTNGTSHFNLDFTFNFSDRYNWDTGKELLKSLFWTGKNLFKMIFGNRCIRKAMRKSTISLEVQRSVYNNEKNSKIFAFGYFVFSTFIYSISLYFIVV